MHKYSFGVFLPRALIKTKAVNSNVATDLFEFHMNIFILY